MVIESGTLWRKLRGRLRRTALPDFVIVGAQKGGTVALWENLNHHPELYLPVDPSAETPREKHFFDCHWDKGPAWYRDQFDRPGLIQGEKTPTYLSETRCHVRMARVIPRAKLVCLLRDPVDRAYSAWNMLTQLPADHWNHTDLAFEAALGAFPHLIDRGCYGAQIDRLLRFFPRRQLFIGISERFRSDPDGQMARLLRFLGASTFAGDWGEQHVRRYRSPMLEAVRQRTAERFAVDVRRLRALLGDDIAEWDI